MLPSYWGTYHVTGLFVAGSRPECANPAVGVWGLGVLRPPFHWNPTGTLPLEWRQPTLDPAPPLKRSILPKYVLSRQRAPTPKYFGQQHSAQEQIHT